MKLNEKKQQQQKIPIPSTYGTFTYIWLICMVNVGKQTMVPWMVWNTVPDTSS